MNRVPQRRSVGTVFMICLLLLAQGTNFATVLCVSGSGHAVIEPMDAFCCAPTTPSGAGASIVGASACVGCTDIPIQLATEWGQPHLQGADLLCAVLWDAPVDSLTHPTASQQPLVAGYSPPISASPIPVTSLRC